jgi:hypothetical protein
MEDIDGIAQNPKYGHMITNACHDEWKVDVGDPRHMLGVTREISYDKETGVGKNHLTLIGFVENLWAKFGHHRKGKKVNILPFPHGESCSPLGDDMASRSRSNKLRNRHYSVLLERFAKRTYYGKTTYYFRFARTQDTCRERCRGRVHICFPRCYLSIYHPGPMSNLRPDS